ncbi:MAG TPA: hypothetical protein VLQ65_03550 [Saliniramus sp.]|nr:hypothetical protein [Saliniramus sp.]
MSRASAARHAAPADHQASVYPDDLQPALQHALALLADIDFRFEQERQKLAHWTAPESVKERLVDEIDREHQRAREPYVLMLAELHRRIMATMGYSSLH